ncbi:MAG: hypothetical protein HQ504_00070 [Rhodospirillaceae bacterium]|nr:hypothetical protein [Rhodospirillaceae bacterium]
MKNKKCSSRLLATVGASALLLSACAPIPPFTIASFALDGISYISTGKSVSDHALSVMVQQDCALGRALIKNRHICADNDTGPMITFKPIVKLDIGNDSDVKTAENKEAVSEPRQPVNKEEYIELADISPTLESYTQTDEQQGRWDGLPSIIRALVSGHVQLPTPESETF